MQFAIFGLGVGGVYVLAAQGIIVVYRGSGVINFASGSMGLASAAVFARLWGPLPLGLALVCGVAAGALLGVLIQVLVMRPLRRSSPLTRLVATLGLLIFIQQLVILRYTSGVEFVGSALPSYPWHPFGGSITVGSDRAIILGIAIASTAVLWAVYRYTPFGLATSAVAENDRAASSLGHSPAMIATVNWAVGGALSALAAILIIGIIGLDPIGMPLLVIPALACALIGRFVSFPLALLGGILIGIAQSEVTEYVSTPGWSDSIPFLVIIALVVISGRALPQRNYLQDRLPELGNGRIRVPFLVVVVGIWVALLFLFSANWADAVTSTMVTAIVCLSLVVVTGYCGQLSLAQFALAGVGAFIGARLAAVYSIPFPLAMLIGIAGTIPIGLIVALPALRTRGVNLAVVTIGLALCIDELVLENTNYTGGLVGTVVKPPTLFGWSIYSVPYPDRYAAVCTVVFVLAALLVANLRRGAAGRRLLAVRANERAAESLGISVVGAKLYAFGLGAAIAAAGGILLAFEVPNVNFTLFGGLQSITAVIDSVIGGIGFIGGALVGGSFGDQGVNQEILGHWGTLANYVTIGSGAILVLVVIFNQDGLAWDNIRLFRAIEGRLANVLRRRRRPAATSAPSLATSALFAGDVPDVGDLADAGQAEPPASGAVAVKARTVAPARPAMAMAERPSARTAAELKVQDVKVAFGGVQALNGVTLSVAGGEVVGVIGPNGAGKTALLDVISGINRNYSGGVQLDGVPIDAWSAYRRARGGIGRASQSLDLFEDESVFDNLRTACDARSRGRYFSDLVWPGNRPLPAQAEAAIDELGISGLLEQRPKELSYGRRRLVAIARALAASPAILLLDEPASGLDDRNTANLSALIRRLADEWGIGILLIEHDMPLVMKVCDRVTVLNFGNQIATGTGTAVRNDPAVIAAYLGEPVSGDEQDAADSSSGLASGQPTVAS